VKYFVTSPTRKAPHADRSTVQQAAHCSTGSTGSAGHGRIARRATARSSSAPAPMAATPGCSLPKPEKPLRGWQAGTGAPAETTARALIVAIARRLRPRLAAITLDHVPEADAELVRSGFARAGWIARVTPQTANWSIDVSGKRFEDYWTERPGQLRSTARRKAAKTPMDLTILDRFDADAWEDYASIYADSWKPDEGSLDFVRAMAEDEGAAGSLRLGLAKIEGRAVAAQLWTVEHGTAIIHKLAHREDVADLSPGTILSKAMFEHVIDRDKVSLIDFGTGDDRYKADWMDTRVMRMRVELYNPRKPAGLFGAAKAALRALVGRGRNV
jgi:hypothetical protein